MTTARCHRHLVEFGMEQHRSSRILTTSGSSVDTHTSEIHVRIFRRGSLHPEDPVFEAGIFQVMPANIMKRLRTIGSPHSIDLYNNETKIGLRSVAAR